jgi:DNA-directed RNA polymerase subunit M/transcription elongation factor TFIIS
MQYLPLKCEDCGESLKYTISMSKNDHVIRIFQCVKCGKQYEITNYRYKPDNCPKHLWVFDRWGFKDGLHNHEIYWIMKCDRCGNIEHKRWDSREVGSREAVSMDDPRVLESLIVNKDTARFHFDKETVTDFWSN